ncbi:MAG: PDZ domain-containing protein [Deltaproteobacteria bacterium]|nr:PDZ domain-containing protein [Deltaproteobacteria bacterium]MBW2085023.1 PDZ domain-containing protein [Deltaproteobacteria bacterium]
MTVSTKHYIWLAHFLILGLIVWSGVHLGATLLAHRLEDRARSQTSVKIAASRSPRLHTLTEYEAIVQNNMFALETKKSASLSAPEPALETETAEASDEFNLKGTIINELPELSFAILESAKSRKQDLYRPGDMVGQAELIQINPGEVLLRLHGKIQRIQIEEPKASPRTRYRRSASASVSRTKTSKIARAVGLNKYVVSREILDQDMGDLYSLLSQINIQPFLKGGQPHGFRLSSIRPNSIFHQFGLRNNDVIVKLNGVVIRQPEDVMGLYRQITQLDTVTLEVERRGRPATFTYTLK